MTQLKIAKAIDDAKALDQHQIPNHHGWVTGYLIENYMISPVLNVDTEHFRPEWWCDIDETTIKDYDPSTKFHS